LNALQQSMTYQTSTAEFTSRLRALAQSEPEVAAPQARALLDELPGQDKHNRLQAARILGIALTKQGRYSEAQEVLRRALKSSEVLYDTLSKADCYNHLALCAYYNNDFDKALRLAYKGLEASRDGNEALFEADALQVVGWVYNNFGLYRDALESFLATLGILEGQAQSDSRKNRVLNAAGMSYMYVQDYPKAETYLTSSLELARQQGDLEGQALALRNLGTVADERDEHENALDLYEQSFELYEQVAEPTQLVHQYLALGKALANLDRFDEARSAFTQALVYLQQVDNISLKIDVSLHLSQLAISQGDALKAHERLCDALKYVHEEAAPADAFRVHRALADSFKQRGEADRALHHFELYHELKERVQKEAEQRRTEGLLLQFDVQRLHLEKEMYRLKHVELAQAYAKLKDLSVRDPLTNLHNRRHLSDELVKEVERARRYGRALCTVLFDIDNFKHINDSFGHQIGDQVLIDVAKLLRERTRASDIVARYGGEEIVIVFPETELGNAEKTCEGIRASIEQYSWPRLHPDLAVTLSIGLVELLGSDDAENLLRRADNKMYEAKRSGKNRICF